MACQASFSERSNASYFSTRSRVADCTFSAGRSSTPSTGAAALPLTRFGSGAGSFIACDDLIVETGAEGMLTRFGSWIGSFAAADGDDLDAVTGGEGFSARTAADGGGDVFAAPMGGALSTGNSTFESAMYGAMC